MATQCPKFKMAVSKVINKYQAKACYIDGGSGVFCYLWITGPGVTPKGNPSKRLVKACFPTGCITLSGGHFDAALEAIPGYYSHYVNID